MGDGTGSDAHIAAKVAGDELPVWAPWLGLYLRLQEELNVLGSVSIEVPELRPAFERLRDALG